MSDQKVLTKPISEALTAIAQRMARHRRVCEDCARKVVADECTIGQSYRRKAVKILGEAGVANGCQCEECCADREASAQQATEDKAWGVFGDGFKVAFFPTQERANEFLSTHPNDALFSFVVDRVGRAAPGILRAAMATAGVPESTVFNPRVPDGKA